MEEAKFTWLPKFTKTLLGVPEEHQAALFRALAQYGNYGIEPEFDDWALNAVFESLREDIDNNKSFRSAGASGGRGNRKRGSAGQGKGESPLSDDANPPSESAEEPETPLCDDSEPGKRGSGKSPSIPYQSIPNQPIPDQPKPKGARRFRAPTPEEVRAYAEEYATGKGLDPGGFSAEGFADYYTANGWKVGRNPMRDWRAAVRDWVRKDCKPKGGGGYAEYDR